MRELAGVAANDAGARARLGRIDEVDGRPVDVGAIVRGARPDEIEARVELALDSVGPGGAAGAGAAARERARAVLDDSRYTGTRLPRPFAGVLRWLGERLDPLVQLIRRLPGPPVLAYLVLALLVVLLAALVAGRSIRRGAGRSGAGGRGARAARREDPAALERAADDAERSGAYGEAVRLRFRAGLLRLDARQVIEYRPSLTTGEVSRALDSPDFAALGRDFDAIAYGGRPADAEAAAVSRERWKAVLSATAPSA